MRFKQYYLEALAALGPIQNDDAKKLAMIVNMGGNFDFMVNWNGRNLSLDLRPRLNRHNGIQINAAKKEIHLPTEYEYDPYEISAIEELNRTGLFNDYKVITNSGVTNLLSVIQNIKPVVGKYQTWANPKHEFRSSTKPFAIKVIKQIHERTFYHATFKKYVSNIKRLGLKPSKVFDDIYQELIASGQIKQGEGVPLGMLSQDGWSAGLNPEKQRAVYMYLDKDKADSLAKYLSYRNAEPSVVLAIDGSGMDDSSKLVVDEDVLRDGSRVENKLKGQLPHFYASALSSLRTIGYKGIIPSQYISIVAEYESNSENYDDNENF